MPGQCPEVAPLNYYRASYKYKRVYKFAKTELAARAWAAMVFNVKKEKEQEITIAPATPPRGLDLIS